ncbi:MAG: hypothetical protein WBV82_08555 [Myxococcaceae bacterium]
MAQKRSDTRTESHLQGERRSEPVPEQEIDEARRAGHGIREREEEAERPTRVPPRGVEPTGDESREARLRASGEFETDTTPTQLEEDFGERGLRMRGGVHDVRHNPSILDPNADEE